MLKHHEDTEAAVSASQARVTPEELSEALAAIEARKQAEASRLAGTIPIEQAVSELNLDSSPEEIWTEVQAQRGKAKAEQAQAAAEAARLEQAKTEQVKTEQVRAAQEAAARRFTHALHRSRQRNLARVFGPVLGLWALFQFGIIPNIFTHHHLALPVTAHTAQMTTLGLTADGTEVYADSAALTQLSEGKPLSQITVDKTQGGNTWPVFKRGGHVYLRGYILQPPSLKAIAGEPITVFNDDAPDELEGAKTSLITLRVDNTPLQTTGGDDSSYSEFTLPRFQPNPLTTLTPWR